MLEYGNYAFFLWFLSNLRVCCRFLFKCNHISVLRFKQVNYRLNSENHAIFRNWIPKIAPIFGIEFQISRFDSFFICFWCNVYRIKLLKTIVKSKKNSYLCNAVSTLGRLPLCGLGWQTYWKRRLLTCFVLNPLELRNFKKEPLRMRQ